MSTERFGTSIRVVTTLLLALTLSGVSLLPSPALAATYQLSGKVTDQSSNPIVGATVAVIDPSTGVPVASTTTDSSGNYSLSVDGGTYNIQVTPPSGSGFGPSNTLNQTISGDTIVNFVLVPSGVIQLSGRVLDRFGQGILGQTVQLNPPAGSAVQTTTDANGFYSLQVAPGDYYLQVRGPNTSPTPNLPTSYFINTVNPISLSQSLTLDLPLPFRRVDVHVQDPGGTPVPNVALAALTGGCYTTGMTLGTFPAGGRTDYSLTNNAIVTSASGDATFWLFPTSPSCRSYTITAKPPTGSPYATTSLSGTTVTSDMTLPITLATPITLSGRVLDRFGQGILGQTVQLNPPAGSAVQTTTDANGFYSLQVAPGDYYLQVRGPNTSPTPNLPTSYFINTVNPISLSQSLTLDLPLPFRRVDVHVQDPGGTPVPNVALAALTGGCYTTGMTLGTFPAGGRTDYSLTNNAIVTSASGDATFWLFPTSPSCRSYTITAKPPTGSPYATTSLSGTTVTSDMTLPITLATPITLSGRVLDRFGQGILGQTVQLNPPAGSAVQTTTDANGFYSLQVAPGDYYLQVRGPNTSPTPNLPTSYFINTVNPISLSQSLTLDLPLPFRRVDVHVQDPGGTPVPNVALAALTGGCYTTGMTLGTFPAGGRTDYSLTNNAIVTSASGDATFWLFPTSPSCRSYTITAKPPTGSPYATFNISNVTFSTDISEVVVLQFVHAPPVTTATTSPQPNAQGVYPGTATVSLSATATSGFTVANTYFTVDGGSQQTYSTPFTVSGEGSHTITYWSVDNAGVYEIAKTLPITIESLAITTQSPLPDGGIGVPYTAQMEATGGTQPYHWSISSGQLPDGLTIDPDTGLISGTPTTAGTFGFTVQVTDNSQITATKQFALAPPPSSGTGGSSYDQPVSLPAPPGSSTPDQPADCASGTYQLANGSTLPDGLTLDPTTGVISGMPTDGGTYNFTVQCTTITNEVAQADFTITIYNPAPVLTGLDPSAADEGGSGFTLHVLGSGFVQSSTVLWNGSPLLTTTYVSANELTASVPAANIAAIGSASVTVSNPVLKWRRRYVERAELHHQQCRSSGRNC